MAPRSGELQTPVQKCSVHEQIIIQVPIEIVIACRIRRWPKRMEHEVFETGKWCLLYGHSLRQDGLFKGWC